MDVMVGNMKKYYHVTPHKNLKKILTEGLLPKKGKRSQNLGEKKSAIYLFDSIDDAEDAVMNWMGDEFPESERLVLLEITLPNDFKVVKEKGQFETISYNQIPKKYIKYKMEM